MAKNRYAKKIQKKQIQNHNVNTLKDMSSYLNDKSISESEIQQISLSNIKINPHNDYRQLDSEQDIEILAEDIKRNGLLHNLVVSKRSGAEYVILSGERRFKALNLLHQKELEKHSKGDTTADIGKYRQVQCRVLKNLSPRKEQIILDAANLQTRGGAGNEKITRLAMERYRDNIKAEYSLTDSQAKDLILKISNIGRSNVYRNIKIIDNLIPELTELLNNSEISKREADEFVKLNTQQQTMVYDAILAVKAIFSDDSTILYAQTKNKALKAILQACEEKTDKDICMALENIKLNIAKEKENNLPKTIQSVKQSYEQSYREKILKECDDIHKKIEKLKKKKINIIKEMDSATNNKDINISYRVDALIKELQEFYDLITEGEKNG